APSQFEMNYGYPEAGIAADQVLLYKLICRQVAARFDMTASFLPKPATGINGSGMHTNLSVSQKGKNLFFDPKGPDKLSKLGYKFIDRILSNGQDTCLLFNPSVNAYRRLDPHFEAPNQIKASAVDRGAMPQSARRADQDSRDSVPPRGDESVFVGEVLGRRKGAKTQRRNVVDRQLFVASLRLSVITPSHTPASSSSPSAAAST